MHALNSVHRPSDKLRCNGNRHFDNSDNTNWNRHIHSRRHLHTSRDWRFCDMLSQYHSDNRWNLNGISQLWWRLDSRNKHWINYSHSQSTNYNHYGSMHTIDCIHCSSNIMHSYGNGHSCRNNFYTYRHRHIHTRWDMYPRRNRRVRYMLR